MNDKELRKKDHLPKTKIETDSYIAVQLLEYKKLLNEESIKFPRDILVKSYENNLITDEKVWINMMFDRNKTSHIYDEEEANKMYHNIENNYFPVMRDNYESIKKRLEIM